MKKIFCVIVLLLSVQFCFGQRNPGMKCGWYGKKTPLERKKIAPFDKAKKILLIAFPSPNAGIIVNGNQVVIDSITLTQMNYKVIKSFTTSEKYKYYATEIVELPTSQIDELSNWMINFKVIRRPKEVIVNMTNCYEPRNAVLFLDENNNVVSHLEICFECGQYYLTPESISDFNDLCKLGGCDEHQILLKEFFRKSGIKYGIDMR
ncbi:hypothetical protein [Flavobacterium pedocola]